MLALALSLSSNAVAQKGHGAKRPSGKGAAAKRSAWPPFATRREDWLRRKQSAASAGDAGPEPLAQYLVDEVIVTGVFEAEHGPGVFLLAKPTGTTFFVEAGATLFNGRLVEITLGESGFVEDTEVVFAERSGPSGAERRVVKRVEAAPGPEPTAPEGPA